MSRVQGILLAIVLAATAPASAATWFDVSVDLTSAGPPYPTSPTQTKLFQESTQVGLINMGLHNVSNAPLAAHIRAWDPAGGPGAPSSSASFGVFLEASQPTPPTGSSSFFDIWMEPLTNDGQAGSIPSGGGGFIGGGSGGTYSSSFDASVNVVTDGGGPRLLNLYSEAPAGQPVHFADGSTVQIIDGKLRIIPKLVFDGPVENALPLFTITMTPEPASMLLLLVGVGLLRLQSTR
jgi:hypothetical protein